MSGAPAETAPSWDWSPRQLCSRGADAVELAALAGLHLDPWQQLTLDRILGEDADGRPAAFESAVIIPRQNGKGAVLEALSLYWLFVERVPLVLHSAHEFKTAAEAFRRLRSLIEGCEELAGELDRVLTGAGSEAIRLTDGRRLRYVARSKGSGRGFTADKVILDEAYALSGDEMAALLPTLATRTAAQVVYTSSAGMVSSHVLRGVRDRGRAGGDPSLAYVEWGGVARCPKRCDHGLDDEACALNDRDLWAAGNPRVGLEFIAKERRALPPQEFARERLGVWDEPTSGGDTIPLAAWAARTDDASTIAGRRALAFDISPDRRSAAIGGAGPRVDGGRHLALVEHRAGTSWLVPRLLELVEKHDPVAVVVDGMSPAGTEIQALTAAGLKVRSKDCPSGLLVVLGAMDQARSCGLLHDAIAGDAPSAWHRGDPIVQTALEGAARRDIGDGGWAFGRRRSDVDITPIVVIAEAHYGLAMSPVSSRPLVAWR